MSIEITPALLSDLRQKAEAASPAVMLALINQLDWQTAQHIEEIKNCIDLQKIIDDLKKEIEDLKDRCDC